MNKNHKVRFDAISRPWRSKTLGPLSAYWDPKPAARVSPEDENSMFSTEA